MKKQFVTYEAASKLKESGIETRQTENLRQYLETISREPLVIESINNIIYAFGSELACLRLEHKYNNRKHCYCGYSVSRNTYFFVIEK